MGAGVGNLTNPGIEYNGAPEAMPQRDYFDTEGERDLAFAGASRAALQPSAATAEGDFVEQSAPMPKMVKPSFSEVAAPGTQINKGETKLGKLIHLLTAGIQGGIAGRAASERAVAESGGRRSAGFATGAMAAIEEPQRQRRIKQQMEATDIANQQNQAETEQRRVLLPWLLKNQQLQGKHLESQIAENNAQAEKAKREPTDKLIDTYDNDQGQRVVAFQKQDGSTYEVTLGKVQPKTPKDTINEWTTRAAAARGEKWAVDLLKQKQSEEERLRYISHADKPDKPEKPLRATPYQSAQIEDEYQTELKEAEEWFRNPKFAKETILDKRLNEEVNNPDYIPDADRETELKRRKTEAEKKYKKKIVAMGGSASSQSADFSEVEGGNSSQQKQAAEKKPAKVAAKVGEIKYLKRDGKRIPYKFDGKQWVLSGGSS
jgi:hypothetical protein